MSDWGWGMLMAVSTFIRSRVLPSQHRKSALLFKLTWRLSSLMVFLLIKLCFYFSGCNFLFCFLVDFSIDPYVCVVWCRCRRLIPAFPMLVSTEVILERDLGSFHITSIIEGLTYFVDWIRLDLCIACYFFFNVVFFL